MPYTYEYPHPAVATDIVIFAIRFGQLNVLLIRRGLEPFRNHWALPGGFLSIDENLEDCAKRELQEETGIDMEALPVHLEQVAAFGAAKRDIRKGKDDFEDVRVLSVAYMALLPADSVSPQAATDAAETKWFAIDDLKKLAFDHDQIIAAAQAKLRQKLSDRITDMKRGRKGAAIPLAASFLGERFTISDLKAIYDLFDPNGKVMDISNFRKMVKESLDLEEVGTEPASGRHRPAKIYQLKASA